MKEERSHLQKWEVVYVDTNGKFQVKSARDYFYYSVFVDRKDDEKIAIGHVKKRGFATYRNVYGVVILTGKDTHIVGNLQVVFDSLFMPFKDKPTTNPRLETLYRVLGRVNDRLKANR